MNNRWFLSVTVTEPNRKERRDGEKKDGGRERWIEGTKKKRREVRMSTSTYLREVQYLRTIWDGRMGFASCHVWLRNENEKPSTQSTEADPESVTGPKRAIRGDGWS